MTRVEFFDQDGRITGFSCSGHSGYAEEGSDIVCAAVSTAVKLAECTINDVLGERAKTGMMLTLCSLRDDYPDYIEVLEVSNDA